MLQKATIINNIFYANHKMVLVDEKNAIIIFVLFEINKQQRMEIVL